VRLRSMTKKLGLVPCHGRFALVEITSGFQVHLLIVKRWSGTLGRRRKCSLCMCGQSGYLEGRVGFSCRVVHCRQETPRSFGANDSKCPTTHAGNANGSDTVDLIALLNEYTSRDGWVLARTGADFANGHKQATGSSLPAEVWERF